jgi:hypothetical protein
VLPQQRRFFEARATRRPAAEPVNNRTAMAARLRGPILSVERKKARSFLKKRTKKLL